MTQNSPGFLAGGGEMGERIRYFNWSATSLGAPDNWPQSLKTCVRIMLSSQQPIWIGWGKDLIKLYNDAYIDIVRGKHPGALGKPASVVWQDIWKDVGPMLSKAMLHDEGTYVESQLLIMQRSGFPEETYYTFSYTPVLGDDNKPAGIICYNTADTERIINERSLTTLQALDSLPQIKTEHEVYRQALRAIENNSRDFPFAMIHRIHPENGSAIYAAGPQYDFSNEIELAADSNRMIESVNDGRWNDLPKGAWDVSPQHFLQVPIRSANKRFPLAVLTVGLNPYRKLDNQYKNFIQLIADQVSLSVNNALAYEEERKRAEELEALDKAKTQFFTNISHEFRTPITLMLGPLEDLLNKTNTALSDQEKDSVTLVHRNALRLLRLVNTLLDFSRIESGRQQPSFVSTDFVSATTTIAAHFKPVMEKAGLLFTINKSDIQKNVLLDPGMWEKIVFNLLSNAYKYTLSGSVSVLFDEKPGMVRLTVSDTGVGIPENELPHMFDRFHRVENAGGRSHEGTGIGLSLTKELVLLHKGTISVESRPGSGSSFTIDIPSGTDHIPAEQLHKSISAKDILQDNIYTGEMIFLPATVETELPANRIQPLRQDRQTVLIADDNADMRHYLASLLGSVYEIVIAANGKEALDTISQQPIDLVLSDIMMPVMDGIALLRNIKNDTKTAHIPVILITARAGEESRMEGFETGADDYLVKPFSAGELQARIKSQLTVAKVRTHAIRQIQSLFQQAPIAIQILTGANFTYELVNNRSLELVRKTKEEITGRTVDEVFPELRAQGFIALLEKVYSTGEIYVSDETQIDYYREGKKVQTFAKFVYAPLRDEQGTVTGIMVTGDDITAQVQARRRIEENAKLLTTLTETLPQLIWMTDGKGKQEFVSGRWMEYTGVEPKDEASWQQILHPDDEAAVNEAWSRSIANGSGFTVEVRLKSRQGEYEWHYGQGEPINNDAGEVIYWIGSYTNIHEQKTFTQELQLRDERKDDFILMASHELKTPVTTIKGYVQLLMKMLNSSSDFPRDPRMLLSALEAVDKQVNSLTRLITELLDLSKIEKGQLELDKTRFAFTPFIKETVQNAQFLSQQILQLDIQFDCFVYADRNRIGQVLLNLITNAAKYSPGSANISIQVLQQGESAVAVSVQDYGIGIEEKEQQRIFERFYRVEGKKEKTFPGFGIGLFIAKDIIIKHQGQITVSSEKGKGSRFTFVLPFEAG